MAGTLALQVKLLWVIWENNTPWRNAQPDKESCGWMDGWIDDGGWVGR